MRKKGAWFRSWLLVGSTGHAEVLEAGKNAIMQRAGLPARDLRMLDPALSYPSTVLGRERDIVVNLKIQGIFRLRQAIILSKESGGDDQKGVWTDFYSSDQEPQSMADGHDQICTGRFHDKNEEGGAGQEQQPGDFKLLPFEFVALEACLDATCSMLDYEARRLEQEAHPDWISWLQRSAPSI